MVAPLSHRRQTSVQGEAAGDACSENAMKEPDEVGETRLRDGILTGPMVVDGALAVPSGDSACPGMHPAKAVENYDCCCLPGPFACQEKACARRPGCRFVAVLAPVTAVPVRDAVEPWHSGAELGRRVASDCRHGYWMQAASRCSQEPHLKWTARD